VVPSLAGFPLAGAGDVVVRLESGPRLQRALLIPLVVLAWLGLLLVVAWLLAHVTRALLIVILATLIAFALTPLVNLLAHWMPRVIAVALSYMVGFIVTDQAEYCRLPSSIMRRRGTPN
jgi:CHASE2 domain-containing sensor protein